MVKSLQDFGRRVLATIDPENIVRAVKSSYPPRNALDVARLSGAGTLGILITLVSAHAVDLFFRTISFGTVTRLDAWIIVTLSPSLRILGYTAATVSAVAYAVHFGGRAIQSR